MRQCTKCEEWKEENTDNFYGNSRGGLMTECKICFTTRERNKYQADKQTRDRKRNWAKNKRDKDKHSEYNKEYTKTIKGKEVQKNSKTKYRRKYPEKIRAKNLVHYYVRQGKIPHVSTQFCKCGKPSTDYHHPDYSKPLEIVPLCRKHHLELHKVKGQLS